MTDRLNPGTVLDRAPMAQEPATQARATSIANIIRPAMVRASADPSVMTLTDNRRDVEANVQAVALAAAMDGETANKLNAEPWWQSGVLWATIQAFLLALWAWIKVVPPMFSTELDMELVLTMTGAVGTAAWGVYRRAAPNLTPLFWRRTWRTAAVVAVVMVAAAAAVVVFL